VDLLMLILIYYSMAFVRLNFRNICKIHHTLVRVSDYYLMPDEQEISYIKA